MDQSIPDCSSVLQATKISSLTLTHPRAVSSNEETEAANSNWPTSKVRSAQMVAISIAGTLAASVPTAERLQRVHRLFEGITDGE